MLTETETAAISEILRRYENPHGACIEALREFQHSHGSISNEDLCDLARMLGVTPDELEGVALMHDLGIRRPTGRSVILLCDGASCWIKGCGCILERLESTLGVTLGQTTADGRFTLLPGACLGACEHAPVMMIGRELFDDLDPDKLESILDWYE